MHATQKKTDPHSNRTTRYKSDTHNVCCQQCPPQCSELPHTAQPGELVFVCNCLTDASRVPADKFLLWRSNVSSVSLIVRRYHLLLPVLFRKTVLSSAFQTCQADVSVCCPISQFLPCCSKWYLGTSEPFNDEGPSKTAMWQHISFDRCASTENFVISHSPTLPLLLLLQSFLLFPQKLSLSPQWQVLRRSQSFATLDTPMSTDDVVVPIRSRTRDGSKTSFIVIRPERPELFWDPEPPLSSHIAAISLPSERDSVEGNGASLGRLA